MNQIDIVVGLQYGDEGKGKVTSLLCKNNSYDYVCRWNGGHNAGHTVHIGDKAYKTHLIPSGIFHGIKSHIGAGCILNIEDFLDEIQYLEKNNFDTSLISIDPLTHIVEKRHKAEDMKYHAIRQGSTSKGVAPCYADKYARKGITARQEKALRPWLEEMSFLNRDILCEGAQGIQLDIDCKRYPYVTSSHCYPWAACSLGFSHKEIRNIYGVAKLYATRSGFDPYFNKERTREFEDVLEKLSQLGKEIGVTTGRERLSNFITSDKIVEDIRRTGTNIIVFNKCDIVEKFISIHGYFILNNKKYYSLDAIKDLMTYQITKNTPYKVEIIWSDHPGEWYDRKNENYSNANPRALHP